MCSTLDRVTCASLPLGALGVLADLRRETGIRVLVREDRAWIRWPSGDDRVLLRELIDMFLIEQSSWLAKLDAASRTEAAAIARRRDLL